MPTNWNAILFSSLISTTKKIRFLNVYFGHIFLFSKPFDVMKEKTLQQNFVILSHVKYK